MDGDARQLDAVADELYRLPLEEFIPARDARVKELRKADRPLATAIGKLRKPGAAAWVVNLLVHESPELLDQLAELAEALRAAQDSLSGEQLRALSSQRHQVVASVVRESRRLATARGVKVGDAVQRELEATFDAALADPSAAQAIRSGRLTTSLSYAGLGEAGLGEAGAAVEPAPVPAPSRPRTRGKADADARAAAAAAEAERRRAEHEEAVRAAEQASTEAAAARDEADAERAQAVEDRDAAQQRVEDLQAQIEQAQQEVAAGTSQVREADRKVQKAERSASAAERRLASARDALAQLTG